MPDKQSRTICGKFPCRPDDGGRKIGSVRLFKLRKVPGPRFRNRYRATTFDLCNSQNQSVLHAIKTVHPTLCSRIRSTIAALAEILQHLAPFGGGLPWVIDRICLFRDSYSFHSDNPVKLRLTYQPSFARRTRPHQAG